MKKTTNSSNTPKVFTTQDHFRKKIVTMDNLFNISDGIVTGHPKSCEIHGTLIISKEHTLEIQPGTVIKFDRDCGLHIEGKLIAIGNPNHTILFTSNIQTKKIDKYWPMLWRGIVFKPFSQGKDSIIKHCKINYAISGVHCRRSSPTIVSNIISNNLYGVRSEYSYPLISNNYITYCSDGVYSVNSPSSTIINNSFFDNGCGIYCFHSSPLIEGNKIVNDKLTEYYFSGIWCYYSSPIIRKNTIKKTPLGIVCDHSSSLVINNYILDTPKAFDCISSMLCISNPRIYNNIIRNNKLNIIADDISVVDARNNYWGTCNIKNIESKIKGNVEFKPYLINKPRFEKNKNNGECDGT